MRIYYNVQTDQLLLVNATVCLNGTFFFIEYGHSKKLCHGSVNEELTVVPETLYIDNMKCVYIADL